MIILRVKMEDLLDKYSKDISKIYSRELGKDERVHQALEELAKHPPKISKLYEREKENHLKEEIIDILLLAHVLKNEIGVKSGAVEPAADHFIDKIDKIYQGKD